jgi:hypothetical protein
MSRGGTKTVTAEKKIDTRKERRILLTRQAFPNRLLLLAGTT